MQVGSNAAKVAMDLLHRLAKVVRRDDWKCAGALLRERGVADDARAEQGVADEVDKAGKDGLESERSGVGFDNVKKGRATDTAANGGASGWGRIMGIEDEEEILLWGIDDNKEGVSEGVEHEAQIEQHRTGDELACVRKWQSTESFCNTDADSDMACPVGRDKEEAGVDAMRVIGGRCRLVGVWVECRVFATGDGGIEQIGSIREIGISERGEVVGSLDEEEVGDRLGLTDVEKVEEEWVGLAGRNRAGRSRRRRTSHDDCSGITQWGGRRQGERVGMILEPSIMRTCWFKCEIL